MGPSFFDKMNFDLSGLLIMCILLQILSLTQANSDLQKHVRDLEREIHQNQLSQFRGSSSQISGRGSASSEGKVLTEITNFKLSNTDLPDYLSEHEEHGYPVCSKFSLFFISGGAGDEAPCALTLIFVHRIATTHVGTRSSLPLHQQLSLLLMATQYLWEIVLVELLLLPQILELKAIKVDFHPLNHFPLKNQLLPLH